MKFSQILPFIVAVAVAQDEPIEPTPLDELAPIVQPYAQALINVNDSTIALDQAILAYQGADQAISLLTASNNLASTIQDETAAVEPLPTLENEDFDTVFGLATYVVNLGYYVNLTIFDLVSKKQTFVDTCVGGVVLNQLTQQSSAADTFQSLVIARVPETLRDIASGLASTIPVALASGISAFADQTSLPASCTATSTTTTTTSTSTSSGTATSTATSTSSSSGAGEGWYAETSFGGYKPSSYTKASTPAPTNVYEWATITSEPSKPTGASTYKPSGAASDTTKAPVYTTSSKLPTYTGAANVNQIGGVAAVAALAAALL